MKKFSSCIFLKRNAAKTITAIFAAAVAVMFSIMNIVNAQNLSVSISGDTTLCFGNCTQLTAVVRGGTPPYTYSWPPDIRGNAETYNVCSTAPTQPPAEICGNAAILDGPAVQPPGSVRVDPGQDLNSATQANPPYTNFWLSPGVHKFGTGIFSQVIPKNGDTYIGAPGAIIDGQNINRYAFTQEARHVTISHLTIRNFNCPQNEGVVNHDSGNDWTIEYCTLRNNHGAAMMAGARQQVRYNCLANNGEYAMNAYQGGDGIKDLVVDHNEIKGNATDIFPEGCGCSGGIKFWAVKRATVTNNWVHNNKGHGLWADTNDEGFLFKNNYINDNEGFGIFYEISYNAAIINNTFKRNGLVHGRERQRDGSNFPEGAIYISESGGDARVNGGIYSTLEIAHNYFEDNWGGVIMWENADRFAGSPANTSGGYYTIVNPDANPATCKNPAKGGSIDVQPYYSDCRWKTQNVSIHNNEFHINRAAIGCTSPYCGLNALISNHGTYPRWSPYKGDKIQKSITFRQNNYWSNNRYFGDWKFNPFETGNIVNLRKWQAAPYNQDAGSTINVNNAAETKHYTVTVTDKNGSTASKIITIHEWSFARCANSARALNKQTVSEAPGNNDFEASIAPNPIANVLSVNFKTNDSSPELQIVNSIGQIVLSAKSALGNKSYRMQLNVSSLPKGVYLLLIKTKRGISKEKFVKE